MRKALITLTVLFAMMSASLSAKAQEITITLLPGCTWISYTNAEAMSITTALGDFVPMEGDVIKSQYASTTYNHGRWMGRLQQFTPGLGYMYISRRGEPVSFVFAGSTPQSQVTVTTSEPMLVTAISAIGGGEVTTNDGAYIIVKGLCWATHENPTTNDDYYQEAESGVGTFSISMTGLNIATTYYVRAYAVTPNGTIYGDQKSFTTRDGIPEVTTDLVTNISGDGATCYGTVTDNGGLTVTARGVCWSTSHNPTVSDSHTTNGSGLGSFTSNMNGMTVSTTYYVRAYASTSQATVYGEEVCFTTRDGIPEVETVEVSHILGIYATCCGMVTDNGGLNVNDRGICWSIAPNPTLNGSFTSDGSGLGSFTGRMTGLTPNTTYYVRAYVSTSQATVYGEEMSFTTLEMVSPGMIAGAFTINNQGGQVYFSQGNLQYQASNNIWRFAENQWDYVGTQIPDGYGNISGGTISGSDNANASATYDGWIDLFAWGTSGYNHGAIAYQPWSTNTSYGDHHAYGQTTTNLYDQTGQADWGYNPIINGGNAENSVWRTPTYYEWDYIINTRNTLSGIRYAKAQVNDVNGMILLPDDWSIDNWSLNNTDSSNASYNSNIISAADWQNYLEANGAVFIPAASTSNFGIVGDYWSSSYAYTNNNYAYCMWFSDLTSSFGCAANFGHLSVRLVCPTE